MSLEQDLARAFLDEHPREAAVTLERMPPAARLDVLRLAPAAAAAAVGDMVAPAAADTLARLTPAEAAPVLDRLDLDVAIGLLRRMPAAISDALIAALPDAKQAPLRRSLHYPEGTAGALMDPAALALPDDITVAEARVRLRREAHGLLYYLFVVDRDGVLVGVLDIPELMRARSRDAIRAVMRAPVEHVPAWTPATAVRVHPAWRSFHALPVTDEDDRLVGAIRYQTLRRLEHDADTGGGAQPTGLTVGALGELFHLGLAGFVEGVAAAAAPSSSRGRQGGALSADDADARQGRRAMNGTQQNGVDTLARLYVRQFPQEAARHIESARLGDAVALLESEPTPNAVAVIERLASNVAADVLQAGEPEFAPRVLQAMDPVRAAATLAWLDEPRRDTLLATLDDRAARELRGMAEYPAETAGRLMDPRVIAFRRGATVQQALTRLRGIRRRAVHDVFLLDDEDTLAGRVPLQSLAVARPHDSLESLAEPAVPVAGTATADEVVEHLTSHRLASLPVVDIDGRLLGVIREDVLMTTARQDVAADIQAMVGARQERALSRVSFAVRARLPWLHINLVTAFIAAGVVGLFESTIAAFTALAVLLPVVAGQSGNAGAQALAVTMRGLALREVRVAQWARVTRKEALVALINGWAIAATTGVAVFFWSGSIGLSGVIATSMVISMVAAGAAGAAIPMILTSLGRDPAQSSSIVLTTVTDVVGFSSFLGIATLLASSL